MSTPTITRIDVDYVTVMGTRIVRYRWNTNESDQWRKAMRIEESRRRWDYTAVRRHTLPEYVKAAATAKLAKLTTRTNSTVKFDDSVPGVLHTGEPTPTDTLWPDE